MGITNARKLLHIIVRARLTTPESKKGSPKVNFPAGQWFSNVERGKGACFELVYPLQHSGVVIIELCGNFRGMRGTPEQSIYMPAGVRLHYHIWRDASEFLIQPFLVQILFAISRF